MRAIAALVASTRHKAVCWALALRSNNETGESWPSYRTLASDAGMSPSTAKRTVQELVAGQVRGVRVEKRTRPIAGKAEADSNVYRLHVEVVSGADKVVSGADHLRPNPSPEVVSGEDHVVLRRPDRGPEVTPPVVSGSHHPGPEVTQELLTELPNGTAHRTDLLVLTSEPITAEASCSRKAKRAPKHTPEQIAAKDRIVAAFVETVKAKKGIEPKLAHPGEHAAAFQLAKTYGAEEAASIVRRALEDPFVLGSNCTIRYVASKADSWRGTPAVKANGRPPVQPAAAPGERAFPIGRLRKQGHGETTPEHYEAERERRRARQTPQHGGLGTPAEEDAVVGPSEVQERLAKINEQLDREAAGGGANGS
jgi:hypothetical protein